MKKLLLTLIMSIVLGGTVFAQWYPQTEFYNPKGYDTYFNTAYPFDKGLYGNVDYPIAYLKCNDANITIDDRWDDFEVGAFVGDELRGFIFMTTEYCGDGYLPMFDNIFVYSNDDGEVVSFKVYDHATGTEYECTTNLTIVTGDDSNYYGVYDDPEGISDESLFISFTTGAEQTFTKQIVGYGGGTGRNGYYFIASPVDDVDPTTVTDMIDGEYDLYFFDQGVTNEEWQNYKANNFNLSVGSGYLYAKETDVDLVITGIPTTGTTFDVTLDKVDGANMKGWNLVGNPFGVQAYINRPYYILEGTDNYVEKTANDPIEVMQGILVQANDDGETLTFTTEAPTKSATLALNVTNGNDLVDRATVCFGEGRNLSKLNFRENSSKLYMTEDNKDYAVICTEAQGKMPVNFKAENNGTYTLSFNTENVEFGYLHLIDNMTGNDVDLLATSSYTFDALTTDYASRFKLVFATGNDDDQFAFIGNGEIILNGVNGNTTVQLFDVTGRMLSSTNGANRISTENMAAGVYMIRLVNGNDVKTQKIVVK